MIRQTKGPDNKISVCPGTRQAPVHRSAVRVHRYSKTGYSKAKRLCCRQAASR